MATQIKIRRGLASQWSSANPTLADGEIGFETDTLKFKLGNGSSSWSSLPYAVNKSQIGLGNIDNTSDLEKVISTATQAALDLKANSSDVLSSLQLKADQSFVETALAGKENSLGFIPENSALKNVSNGYAGIDGSGKIPMSLLPASLMNLHGQWDASTNTPTLADHGIGDDVGDVYECTVPGTVDFGSGAITFELGDWAVYGQDGHWYRSPNSNLISSVNGYTGIVNLNKSDIGLSHVDNTSDNDKPLSYASIAEFNLKVDKVAGKGLSTEDFTTSEKSKLAGIESGATANSSDSYLLNRANHTGLQTSSTISDFSSSVNTLIASANIDASKIDGGNVSNAEFAFLNGVTSGIQSQLDGKQPTGNYLTALTGDVSASGPGSSPSTLSNTGVTAGTYQGLTVDAKGRITNASQTMLSYVSSVATSSNANTFAAATGLTTASLPAGVYKFSFFGQAQTAATGTGIGVRVAPVTATMTTLTVKWMISQAANGTAQNFQYDQLAINTNVTAASSAVANTNFAVMGEGVFRLTVAGTVRIETRSETNGSNTILQPDSVLIIEAL